ncbi:MAG: hypothetical protein QM686_19340, partial [Herbaspirillum sp.]
PLPSRLTALSECAGLCTFAEQKKEKKSVAKRIFLHETHQKYDEKLPRRMFIARCDNSSLHRHGQTEIRRDE